MAKRPTQSSDGEDAPLTVSAIDQMLLSATERGDETLQTGRYIVTYSEEATDEARETLAASGLRVADARDYSDQAAAVQDVGESDAMVFPEIGAALVAAPDFAERGMALAEDSRNPVQTVEPEYFVFADDLSSDYLRGFRRAIDALSADAGLGGDLRQEQQDVEAEVLGATWGLTACKVPQSSRSGLGIRVAVLDTGMAFNHPDFVGRSFLSATFVGQPPQDLHGHGTHCIGTACGPQAPAGPIQRYGIGYRVAPIFVGKVLTNSGSGTTASVLAGMNWAIANNCVVISMSLGSQSPPQAAYTAAGRAALNRGCLIVAAAGNAASQTGSPANSPTIMSVASLDRNLAPSSFSNFGKIDIAAPGRDIFSAAPMPRRYATMSGTSMATPHVAGCAALWAQSSPGLRGQALWNKLLATAKPLPYPPSRVGRGLVQAPA